MSGEVVGVGGDWDMGRRYLQDGHLSGGVLHSHTIWAKLKIRLATLDLCGGIVQMTIDNFFAQGKGSWRMLLILL